MGLFNELQCYKTPLVQQINPHVHVAIYNPEKKHLDKKSIISIYNTKDNTKIQLYSDTLVNICNLFITNILTDLNSLPSKNNKKVSKRPRKKK